MQSVMEPITPGPLPLITHISRELGASVQIMPLLSTSGNLSGFPLDRCSPHQNLYLLSLSHLCWPLTKPPNHSITFWFLFFEIMLHPRPQHGNLNMISSGQMQLKNILKAFSITFSGTDADAEPFSIYFSTCSHPKVMVFEPSPSPIQNQVASIFGVHSG